MWFMHTLQSQVIFRRFVFSTICSAGDIQWRNKRPESDLQAPNMQSNITCLRLQEQMLMALKKR